VDARLSLGKSTEGMGCTVTNGRIGHLLLT